MPCQLQVLARIILAASPRCFPYTIAKSAMRDTAVGIWSALEQGNRGQHRPGWSPRVRQGAILTTGLVRTLLGHQLSSRWTPVHKPSSNFGLPIALITGFARSNLPTWAGSRVPRPTFWDVDQLGQAQGCLGLLFGMLTTWQHLGFWVGIG